MAVRVKKTNQKIKLIKTLFIPPLSKATKR